MNGSWEKIYTEQGRVQIEILDTAIIAREIFYNQNYKDILDLGCGTGRHTFMLADKGFNVHACDISDTGLRITEQLLKTNGFNNVTYSIQDMYNLTLANESFDGILCIWVQGHGVREQIKKGITEAYRILKKGGTFFTDFVLKNDITYGIGEEIAPDTFVGGRPGEEGIPHYYTTIDELKDFFSLFSKVNIERKIYRFFDNDNKEHIIEAAVVIAIK